MKKIIPILIIIFLVPCFLIVKADYDGSGGDAGVGNTCGGAYCWLGGVGVRMTLITTDGTQIGKSNNIIHPDYFYTFNNAYKLGTGCSKVQYLQEKSGCIANGNRRSWNTNKTLITSSSKLNDIFIKFGVNLTNKLADKKFDEIWNWAANYKFFANDSELVTLYTTLFDLSETEYLNTVSTKLNDLWIVIEPMTVLYDQYGNNYAGTTYEFGKLSSFGYANSVIKRMLPCQLYIEGTIAQNNPTAPGVSISNGSYFNGKLKFVNTSKPAAAYGSKTFEQICKIQSGGNSSDVLNMEYVTGNYGGGVGLVYFKDTVKSELTCDTVNKGLGTKLPTFNQKIDNYYKKGGITEIYKQLGTEINFGSGTVNTKWYINECTCYGTYQEYTNQFPNAKQIYDIPLYDIERLFGQNMFTNYFNQINNDLKNVVNKGSNVSWDYTKYTNLSCGSLNCIVVDFADIVFSKEENPKMTPDECHETYDNKFPILYNQQQLKQCIKDYEDYEKKIDEEFKQLQNSCDLPLFDPYNKNNGYTKEFVNSNKLRYEECFDLYNEQFGTSWSVASYTNPNDACAPNGTGEKPKKYNCTPKYNVGTCLNGENIFYSDSSTSLSTEEFWKNCVFDDTNAYYDINVHKVSDKNSSLTYYDKTLSSSYSEIYCTESLTANFNSDTINVVAGQYFVWDNHSLSGSRTCRTKFIDWDKFKSDLSAAKDQNQADAIYNEMKKCYDSNIWDENLYNLDPTGKLTYYYTVNEKEGLYNVNQKDMNKNITYTGIGGATDCKDTTVKVGNSYKQIKQCTFVEMRKGATVQFSLPSGLYQYINKDNNISFSANQLERLKEEYLTQGKQLNYLDVGYSNLPVEFKVPEGHYGQIFGNGELSITYSDLGHKVGNTATAVDTILDAIDSYNYGNWQCDFIVDDESIIIPPPPPGGGGDGGPSGINLIYRPIDLYDPFPDIDGSGRNTGSNWCNYNTNETDCSNDNQVVYDYILNNRDVEGEGIYLEDPMYTFILTPSIINEIKKYNKQNSYTDYYGTLDDKTYDFKCNEGTGKTCISDYLSHIIDITGAKNQPGTCVDDMFRTYNDPDNFEACRYQNSDWPIFNPPSYENPVEKPDISTH